MGISEQQLKVEKSYLKKVRKILEKIIEDSKKVVDYRSTQINDLKKFMWENLTEYTEAEYGTALYEMDNEVNMTNQKIADIDKYKSSYDSPYFAKIVFKDDLYQDEMPIYIGMKSVQENINFYVYDWRAPISSLFYNYELGQGKYEAPNGEITGELISKIQFKIENGEIIRCFNSEVNIDDDYLQEILSSASSDKMKNIVSTIQREQNTIIRNDKDKYLIVQGVAGSGKTSVALHRIAYLLYKNLDLNSNNILIFSPNDVFSDYISNVLPELGEENVLKSTFSDFALAFLKPYKRIENYSEFLERIYNKEQNDWEIEAIRYKMSDSFKLDIDKFIEEYIANITFKRDFKVNNYLFPSSYLKKLFLDRYKNFPLKERLEEMSEFISDECNIVGKQNKKTVLKFLNETTDITYNPFELYKKFLNSKNIIYNKPNKSKILYEDITGLIYIYFKVNGFPNYSHIKQVVIDEVQDYSVFQIDILKTIFKGSSFTLLGDINQTINPYHKYDTLEELSRIFQNSKYLELNKTYRSSEEIIDYTNKILNLSNVCAIRRNTNIPVDVKNVTEDLTKETIWEDIKTMNSQGIEKIAIITRGAKDAEVLYKKIEEGQNTIQLVSKVSGTVNKPIIVIPSYLSKGLEFDGVIACNNISKNYELDERNLYYVVCTRAQHKLSIYNEPERMLIKK